MHKICRCVSFPCCAIITAGDRLPGASETDRQTMIELPKEGTLLAVPATHIPAFLRPLSYEPTVLGNKR